MNSSYHMNEAKPIAELVAISSWITDMARFLSTSEYPYGLDKTMRIHFRL